MRINFFDYSPQVGPFHDWKKHEFYVLKHMRRPIIDKFFTHVTRFQSCTIQTPMNLAMMPY